jgi:hypothetical protein
MLKLKIAKLDLHTLIQFNLIEAKDDNIHTQNNLSNKLGGSNVLN